MVARIISQVSPDEFPEGRRFAIESAGLSALTQMEWALRRAGDNGKYDLNGSSPEINREINAFTLGMCLTSAGINIKHSG